MQVDTTGLKRADSDMLVVLLKSLPETVKNYVLYHSGADNYESYRKRCDAVGRATAPV